MRQLPWRAEFDAALCAGNSFGYFDDEGNRAFLQAVAGALKPGGRFLLESGWVAESLFPNFTERRDIEKGGIRFQAENRYVPLTGRVENVYTAERGTGGNPGPRRTGSIRAARSPSSSRAADSRTSRHSVPLRATPSPLVLLG